MRGAAQDALRPPPAKARWGPREGVFVVEQHCVYPELDGRDLEPGTRHVWAVDTDADPDAPVGYLRVLDDLGHARIGRVLVARSHRGRGVSDLLMRRALEVVGERPSVLSAQTPLAAWYAGYGYRQEGEEFLDDAAGPATSTTASRTCPCGAACSGPPVRPGAARHGGR